jgi:arabinogalactan endo-1,4-beta-galactosidase
VQEGAGATKPRVIIHIDRGGNWSSTQWFFDNLRRQEVEFDIIGQSYYPWWHGSRQDLRSCLHNAAERYGKPITIVETAFPWRNSAAVAGIPATPEGQVSFVAELTKALKALPDGRGAGIVWWGSEYRRVDGVRTAGFEHRGLFDAEGNLLPAAEALAKPRRRSP